jgi:hypothetical protein
MIKFAKTNPIGIDYWVKQLQDLQERELLSTLNISSSQALFYPKVEKLDEKFICYSSGNNYVEVGLDSKYALITYVFITDNGNNYDGEFYCYGNSQTLFNDRSIVNFKKTMIDALNKMLDYDQIIGVEVLESIEGMQPFIGLKINFKILFYYE